MWAKYFKFKTIKYHVSETDTLVSTLHIYPTLKTLY